MSSTTGFHTRLSHAVMTTGHHSDDQAGRNAPQRNPANDCEHRQADTPVNSATEDESRHTRDRQSGEGFVPDILNHFPATCRITCNSHERRTCSGDAPYYLRRDVTDRKGGGDGYPRFTANEVAKVEIESLFLSVFLCCFIAVLSCLPAVSAA